jgi:hypothetical protein
LVKAIINIDHAHWLVLFLLVTGLVACRSAKDLPVPSPPFQKIILDRGASLYGVVVGESDSSVAIVIADTDDTLLIDRVRVRERVTVDERKQMLAARLAWNPSITYYRSIADPVVIGAGALYHINSPFMGDVKAVEVSTELRLLPFGEDMRGFYIAGYLNYASVVANRSAQSYTWWWSHGWVAGWQWFPMYNVAAGMGMGAEWWHFDASRSGYSKEGYSGTPIFRFDIGYAW